MKRKKYVKPVLEIHGNFQKVTRGGGASTETDSVDRDESW
jgi:hypothetical protein